VQPVVPIHTDELPELSQVGGKGLSLVKMAQGGLPVPGGFVLTVHFFKPWVKALQEMPAWVSFVNAPPPALEGSIAELKAATQVLSLTPAQQEAIAGTLEQIESPATQLFAVRSSSPEEDLEGASFAGVYETVLGVKPDQLAEAVRQVFISSLDVRVVLYKQQHGVDPHQICIAAIVQEQIASDVAGVGFSINPLNNCYDEAVIDANWGLGESVVSGMVEPDQFVVDKVNHQIQQKTLGKKATAVRLAPDGGTEERSGARHDQFALTDDQALTLTDMLERAEAYYRMPVDIEWAFAGGRPYLLQARPITTYIPLPDELLTQPGQPRWLYLDLTLIEQGIQQPLTTMSNTWFGDVTSQMCVEGVGKDIASSIKDGIGDAIGGRTYLNLSNLLRLMSRDSLADEFGGLDAYAADIIRNIDEDDYRAKEKPKAFRWLVFRGLFHSAGLIGKTLMGLILPSQLEKSYQRGVERFLCQLELEEAKEQSLKAFADHTLELVVKLMMYTTIPTLIDAEIAKASVRGLFRKESPEIRALADKLDRALPHNVTTEMGLAIYSLSQQVDAQAFESLGTLEEQVRHRMLPDEFLARWDAFMERFGFRGPRELDLISPRYADDPMIVLRQMKQFAQLDDGSPDPQTAFEQQQSERQAAYEELSAYLHKKSRLKARVFRHLYRLVATFGGYREIHKYYLIMVNYRVRLRVLDAARALVKADRLDTAEQVFDLTIDDLQQGLDDPSLDLRSIVRRNSAFISRIKHIRNFPVVIDSRGVILRPRRAAAAENELAGQAVAAGVVRGPVKVLSHVGEKPIQPGDILVAKATDPGWTPLFIIAGGIVLEVGGLLQHGSLIAREYGKPCVAGVENVTSILKDGQTVELDGTTGIVHLIDD
jgi:phosphohistidine swiveling domain-containing protein